MTPTRIYRIDCFECGMLEDVYASRKEAETAKEQHETETDHLTGIDWEDLK